ncbi:hypothetical protein DW182_15690 [Bacteroides sp. AM16-24]|jgi:hypothetical protein|uniref:hypothetical protein n=1 Tax=Bacteroides sp. AM16-24 TaxID=2292002 RepID=UPI000E4EFD7E|nr:hypothetical protein [Bacteroides sp. AM16-24]RHI05156.1 hypothetical protein DW182_15690 [Bacteroides sp. AM16-24]
MRTFRKIQKIAFTIGIIYGLWLGINVNATDNDATAAFVIVSLSLVIMLSMFIPEKSGKSNG